MIDRGFSNCGPDRPGGHKTNTNRRVSTMYKNYSGDPCRQLSSYTDVIYLCDLIVVEVLYSGNEGRFSG